SSVFYSPTVSFGANVDIAFDTFADFEHFIINRPLAPQDAAIHITNDGFDYPFHSYAYDPDEPNGVLHLLEGTPYITIDGQANGGSLSISKNQTLPGNARHYDVTIQQNSGQLTVDLDATWTGNIGSIDVPELVHVLSNAGTIDLRHTVIVYPSSPYIGPLQLL